MCIRYQATYISYKNKKNKGLSEKEVHAAFWELRLFLSVFKVDKCKTYRSS